MTDFPGGLTLAELKKRADVERSTDDDLLSSYLLAAFEQAQENPPFGCGRRLTPSPDLVNTGTEDAPVWADTADPVDETIETMGARHAFIPDAREISVVTADGVVTTDFKVVRHKGMIVGLRFGRSVASLSDPYDESYGFTGRRWRGPEEVVVTGRFGFLAPLPENLKDAIYVLAARYYNERAALYADQVAVGEGAKAEIYYRQLPARAKLVFGGFTVPAAYSGLA